ncbi:hypothetical protein PCC7418_0940 [Halothece sp. PCC 7418]|uniref:hypothetical protein n=1 Tax=Halothece sp. (strain PCC 7418) TaxID=65093 RepID=UPI0002A06AAE|nr:hypothetical protein [Halothece sp. PCC 7418]AFZ43149.1 hypothetical protein PCC7418_0940 [Halothece sp. PCC 7418]
MLKQLNSESFNSIVSALEDFDSQDIESFSSNRSYDTETGYEATATITVADQTYNVDYADGVLTVSSGRWSQEIPIDIPEELPINDNVTREFSINSSYTPEAGYNFTRNSALERDNGSNASGELSVETDGEGNISYGGTRLFTSPTGMTMEFNIEGTGSYDPETGYDGTTTIGINDEEIIFSRGEGLIETSFSEVAAEFNLADYQFSQVVNNFSDFLNDADIDSLQNVNLANLTETEFNVASEFS